MASIACADCAHHRHRCPSNTKYCKKCRLLRDVEFWGTKTRTCGHEDCENSFVPMYRHDYYCGPCNPGQTANRGTCLFCSTTDAYLITRDVAVCERCARAPGQRKKFIAALRKGQRARQEHPPAEELRAPKPQPVPADVDNAPVI